MFIQETLLGNIELLKCIRNFRKSKIRATEIRLVVSGRLGCRRKGLAASICIGGIFGGDEYVLVVMIMLLCTLVRIDQIIHLN